MHKFLTFTFFSILSFVQVVHGQDLPAEADIMYTGQASERVALEAPRAVTRYRTEVVDTTCHRQVPYQERECRVEYEYQQYCYYVHGVQRCEMRSVPQDRCDYVTRYRTESYACTETRQIPYTAYEGTHKADLKFEFKDQSKDSQAQLHVKLDTNGEIKLEAIDRALSPAQQKIIFLTSQVGNTYVISFVSKAQHSAYLYRPVKFLNVTDSSAQIKFGKVSDLFETQAQLVLQRNFSTIMTKKYDLKDLDAVIEGEDMIITLDYNADITPLSPGSKYNLLFYYEVKPIGHLKILNKDLMELGQDRFDRFKLVL